MKALWFVFLFVLLSTVGASAHEHGRTDKNWEAMSEEEKVWIMNMKMPDSPSQSCCGLADQYWCDKVYARGGKSYCQITDDRDDRDFCEGFKCRPHRPIGQEIEIPDHKMKYKPCDPSRDISDQVCDKTGDKPSNPSGHSILFIGSSDIVYCFIMSTGG